MEPSPDFELEVKKEEPEPEAEASDSSESKEEAEEEKPGPGTPTDFKRFYLDGTPEPPLEPKDIRVVTRFGGDLLSNPKVSLSSSSDLEASVASSKVSKVKQERGQASAAGSSLRKKEEKVVLLPKEEPTPSEESTSEEERALQAHEKWQKKGKARQASRGRSKERSRRRRRRDSSCSSSSREVVKKRAKKAGKKADKARKANKSKKDVETSESSGRRKRQPRKTARKEAKQSWSEESEEDHRKHVRLQPAASKPPLPPPPEAPEWWLHQEEGGQAGHGGDTGQAGHGEGESVRPRASYSSKGYRQDQGEQHMQWQTEAPSKVYWSGAASPSGACGSGGVQSVMGGSSIPTRPWCELPPKKKAKLLGNSEKGSPEFVSRKAAYILRYQCQASVGCRVRDLCYELGVESSRLHSILLKSKHDNGAPRFFFDCRSDHEEWVKAF